MILRILFVSNYFIADEKLIFFDAIRSTSFKWKKRTEKLSEIVFEIPDKPIIVCKYSKYINND